MGVTKINSATLNWWYSNPSIETFDSLGRFIVDPVNYGLSTDGIFAAPSIGAPLLLNYGDFGANAGLTSVPVTAMVIDAWANMSSRSGLAQFRLKFERTTDNDDIPDDFQIYRDDLRLQITLEHH
jgi:hypothetical protein